MPNPRITEVKAFIPARDFELSKRFYQDLGFTMVSEGGGVAYFHHENASFLLQDFCVDEHNDASIFIERTSISDGSLQSFVRRDPQC